MLLASALLVAMLAIVVFNELHWLIGMIAGKGVLLAGITNTPSGASQAPNSAANGFNPTNNDPRMIVVDDAMSLTRANITGWNKSDVESIMFKEVGLDRIIAQTKEARMAGTVQRTLTDLLLSRHAPLKMGGGSAAQSIIQPFRLIPRRNRVNPGYFRISAGAATQTADYSGIPGSAPGTIPGAHWTITVNNGSLDADSSFLKKSPNNVLKNIEKYFMPGHYITVEFLNTNTGVKTTSVCRIIWATNVDSNQAKVVIAPNKTYAGNVGNGTSGFGGNNATGTNGWWENTATTVQKATFQPTVGVVKLQVNSVSDYESYGNALPGYNEYGLIEFWRQTHRWVHKYNDEYVKALGAASTSDGLKKFRLLPLAKLRAQQEKLQDDFFYETVFYGDQIDENQTTSGWQSLPLINDPAWAGSGETGTLPIEYKANTLGIRTQLALAGNVLDNQGGPLDLDSLFEAGYYLRREREGESGQVVDQIDMMTDMRGTRPLLRQLMLKYYKAKYGIDNVTAFVQPNQKITFNGAVVFEYDSYDLPDFGYTLNVFSDLYFDDRISNFTNAQKTGGRSIWFIDWSDIAINVLGTKSVPRTNNLADNVYKYVMQQNVQHVLLNSKTFEVAVGNSNRHRIIENFSMDNPKLTVAGIDLNK